MGRDPAQIRQEIDQARADLAATIAELGSTDVKGELSAKARELQPILRARAQDKIRELKPVLRDRAQAKAQEVKTTVIATGRAKVQELKPVVVARARDRAAELKPVLIARAKDKAAEIKPVLIARASAAAEDLKAKARAATAVKLQDAKGVALAQAAELGGRAVARAKSKRTIAGACGILGAGLIGLVTRRRLRQRSRTRLQRAAAHAELVNRQAFDGMQRARERAVDAVHYGTAVPKRLRRRVRRG